MGDKVNALPCAPRRRGGVSEQGSQEQAGIGASGVPTGPE